MNLSYWEKKQWFTNIDFAIIGSGIVGINCALELRKKHPNAKILIVEKGPLPQGASTKNAGFACFGSISEILKDLINHSEEELVALVNERYKGISYLRKLLGDKNLGYQQYGGNELFLTSQEDLFLECADRLAEINKLLKPVFNKAPFKLTQNTFGFKKCKNEYITHLLEGQIDTGLMMVSLLRLAHISNIFILNNHKVNKIEDCGTKVMLWGDGYSFEAKKVFIATNGFASQFIDLDVQPARAQVLITKPIPDLKIRGTFHIEQGYYYFRNIDNRILLGGGRNLDINGETTTIFGTTEIVQLRLKELLQNTILPQRSFKIDQSWSGIMGVGKQKKPLVTNISTNVHCGVRLGGMGVAIGARTGQQLANLLTQ